MVIVLTLINANGFSLVSFGSLSTPAPLSRSLALPSYWLRRGAAGVGMKERGWVPATQTCYSTNRPQAPPKHWLCMKELYTLIFFFAMDIITLINNFLILERWKCSTSEITGTRREVHGTVKEMEKTVCF